MLTSNEQTPVSEKPMVALVPKKFGPETVNWSCCATEAPMVVGVTD